MSTKLHTLKKHIQRDAKRENPKKKKTEEKDPHLWVAILMGNCLVLCTYIYFTRYSCLVQISRKPNKCIEVEGLTSGAGEEKSQTYEQALGIAKKQMEDRRGPSCSILF